MRKRLLAVVTGVVMVASALIAAPALAQAEPGATGGVVPAAPNIVDPKGDANGYSFTDKGIPGTVSLTGADIRAVWFTNDATNLYTHIQTTSGARAESQTFVTYVGPAAGTDCMQLRMTTDGEGVEPFSSISLSGDCGKGVTKYGALLEEEGPEKTSILTGAFPLADVQTVATTGLLAEPDTLVGFNLRDVASRAGVIDDTDVGTDYQISSGEPTAEEPKEEEPKEEPPGKSDPPGKGKKKGCGKGKGKQKGACPGKKSGKPKPPAAASCPPYVPGEHGAEAETVTVTDAATEEKPVEIKFDAGRGLGGPLIGGVPVPPDQRTHNYHNLVVDTDSAETGLYVKLQFKDRRDYDLYLEYPSGQEATHSGDFNTGYGTPVFTCGKATTGCSSGSSFEQLNGVRTKDCQGWTTDSVAYLTEGGEVTLTAWLGEIKVDPVAPEEGGQRAAALATFWSLLGR